jgi:hypothetical protein
MLQPKKSAAKKPASKKIIKKSTNPADSYPNKKDKRGNLLIGGGEGTRAPFKTGGKLSKARNGKPVKKAFLGSLLGGAGGKAGGGAGGSMFGGMGKQLLGGLANKALGGLMGGGNKGGGQAATAQGGQRGEAQAPMQKRKSTDTTPVRTRGMKKGGKVSKAKNGKSFPDLNKDGKITKADILKGRGVIAQKGAKVKKKTGMDAVKAVGKYVSTFGGATERDNPKQKDINIVKKLKETGTKVKNKLGLKSGGTVKKCKYGCN